MSRRREVSGFEAASDPEDPVIVEESRTAWRTVFGPLERRVIPSDTDRVCILNVGSYIMV